MNLYLISQNDKNGYDTYDSAVVCAHDVDDARHMHPGGKLYDDQNGTPWYVSFRRNYCWVQPDRVMVELIGVANEGLPAGVVCASFNAG